MSTVSPVRAAIRAGTPRWLALALAFALLGALGAAPPVAGQDLAAFEKRLTEHKLANGWTFLIVERPGTPVFSFATVVNVGGAQEVPGITGLAHMFEHMAFKGTTVVGTTNYAAEKKALGAMEAAYQAWQAERLKLRPDPAQLAKLQADFEAREKEAQQYVVSNEFGDIIEAEGGSGLNASTGGDATNYFYDLPANKVELFAYLESERFLNPVFREFYKERSVVQEERRLRVDSNPIGRLVEQFLATAYTAHPYGQPVVGHMSDLQSFTITDAEAFFQSHYAPSNMVTAIVGGIKAKDVIPILEKYFGRIPKRAAPPVLRTVEPPSLGEKVVVIKDPAQPLYLEGYHKPASTHPDQVIYDAIDDILSGGRTGRLYRALVRDQKVAVAVFSFSGLPGSRYPNLWGVYAMPAPGKTPNDVAQAIHAEIERLKQDGVTTEELDRFKTRSKANLLRGLGSNAGLAYQLAETHRLFGTWRELFEQLGRIDQLQAADITRVAQAVLVPQNRTVGRLETSDSAGETSP